MYVLDETHAHEVAEGLGKLWPVCRPAPSGEVDKLEHEITGRTRLYGVWVLLRTLWRTRKLCRC